MNNTIKLGLLKKAIIGKEDFILVFQEGVKILPFYNEAIKVINTLKVGGTIEDCKECIINYLNNNGLTIEEYILNITGGSFIGLGNSVILLRSLTIEKKFLCNYKNYEKYI